MCNTSLVLERLIYGKISDFISKSISPYQFGFRKNHSTLQQLLLFLKDIFNTFQEKDKYTDAIYLDFSKAFDSVPHNELLAKLRHIGITGKLWLWFKSYLSSRLQNVTLNHHSSELLPVSSGVPQGSILGPLLFIVYVNDIRSNEMLTKLLIFADDTKLYHQIKSVEDHHHLQQDLNHASLWSTQWSLKFNTTKCFHVSFSRNLLPTNTKYELNNSIIETKNEIKDLGIILTSNISWDKHYSHISLKAYRMIGLIRRTFSKDSSVSTKKTLYLTLVRSHLSYCSPLWRPCLIKDIKSLESIQRRSTRFILGSSIDYRSRLLELKLLPLMMFFELNDIIFFIRSIKNPTSSFNIKDYITVSTSNTRSSCALKLKHSYHPTNHTSHFYFNRIPRLWNSLPIIDISKSINSIKLHLKHFLLQYFENHFDPYNVCTYHFLCPCNKCSHTPHPPCYTPL